MCLNWLWKSSFLFFILTIFFCGCGDRFSRENFDFTEVNLGHAPSATAFSDLLYEGLPHKIANGSITDSLYDGGLIVIAINANIPDLGGTHFVANAGSGGNIAWVIPNGKYYFYTLGYDSANMAGTPRCGQAVGDDTNLGSPVSLMGGTKLVNINTAGGCGIQPFGGLATTFTVQVCSTATSITQASSATGDCTASPMYGQAASSPTIVSVEIGYFGGDHFGGDFQSFDQGKVVLSKCSTPGGLFPQIVTGDTRSGQTFRIQTGIATFSGAGCASSGAGFVHTYMILGGPSYAGKYSSFTVVFRDGQPATGHAQWVSSGSTAALFLN